MWADGAVLPIPPGKSVHVLLLPSNVSKTIQDPGTDTGERAPWGATREPTERFGVDQRTAMQLVKTGMTELPADRWERAALISKILKQSPPPPAMPRMPKRKPLKQLGVLS